MAIKIAEILEKERRQKLSFAERARKINENIQASRYLIREISHNKGFL